MHFSKTYAQILQELPPELRENAIQYRQLKKLIHQIVSELSSLGLSPTVLHELIGGASTSKAQGALTAGDAEDQQTASEHGKIESSMREGVLVGSAKMVDRPRIVYELVEHLDRIEPHLKLSVEIPDGGEISEDWSSLFFQEQDDDDGDGAGEDGRREMKPTTNVLWSLHQKLQAMATSGEQSEDTDPNDTAPDEDGMTHIITSAAAATISGSRTQEHIIPLASDTEFFKNLVSALEGMSTHMENVHHEFTKTLHVLSRTISTSAIPASASRSFNPHSSLTSHPGSIIISAMQPSKSDLYSWREIFQLYAETEIFEHIGEVKHGERSAEESEKRLQLFVKQATQRGLADHRKFKAKQSRQAWESFIELNLFILNIKKFSEASAEATRKILKKHTKRTALPLSFPFSSPSSSSSHLALLSRLTTTSLPRTLVQAIGETLLPVIPHVDDYACLICTSIAFKPIRLNCGHLFCVRCLVKMQKRGQADCPLCRAPVVLSANKQNVDWALLNFMQDWFPIESREKLKSNEREAAREEMEELGFDPSQGCTTM